MSLLFLSGILGGCGTKKPSVNPSNSFEENVSGQSVPPATKKLDSTQLKQRAEEALQERYGISCEADYVDSLGTGPFNEVTMRITLRTPNGDEVLVEMTETGEDIRDNYPLTWMKPQAEEKADALAKEIWPSASGTAELSAPPFGGTWTKDSALSDIFAGAGIIAKWQVSIPEAKAGQESAVADFSDALYKAGLYGRMSFVFTDGEIFLHGTKEGQPTAEEIQQAFSE